MGGGNESCTPPSPPKDRSCRSGWTYPDTFLVWSRASSPSEAAALGCHARSDSPGVMVIPFMAVRIPPVGSCVCCWGAESCSDIESGAYSAGAIALTLSYICSADTTRSLVSIRVPITSSFSTSYDGSRAMAYDDHEKELPVCIGRWSFERPWPARDTLERGD